MLLHEASATQLTCIFVDNGLMRQGEAEEVESLFRGALQYSVDRRRCRADAFSRALSGVTDPEQKRKTIGKLFIDVFDEAAHKVGGVEFLAQGTLYPDVIESVSLRGGPARHHQIAS